jgi:DNA-binding transcriptional LysR family regulator
LGTRIAITPAGRILIAYAEQILELRKRAADEIAELDRTPRGELIIAANEATCIYVLPQVFSEYKELYPNIQLQVERSFGRQVVEKVLDNQADFGVSQLPVSDKRLQVVKIFSDEIRVIVAPQHPLARRDHDGDFLPVLPRELVGYPLLMPKSGLTRSRLNDWLEIVEPDLQISMELDATEMIKRFVMAGLGISFLASSHCQEEVVSGRLVAVPMGPEPMRRSVGLIYRKDKSFSKAGLGFIQVILDHVDEESGESAETGRLVSAGR